MRNLIIILFLGFSLNGFSQTILVKQVTDLVVEKEDFIVYFNLDSSTVNITESNINRVVDAKYSFKTIFFKGWRQTTFYFEGEILIYYELDNGLTGFSYYHPNWKDLNNNFETILGELL